MCVVEKKIGNIDDDNSYKNDITTAATITKTAIILKANHQAQFIGIIALTTGDYRRHKLYWPARLRDEQI